MSSYPLRFLVMFVVVLWSSNVDAQIFKCVVNGKTIYQSEPCKINIQEKSQSSAFDGWIFGETINHVKRIARNRQLPMSPGTSSYISSYNEKILNRNSEERTYTYKTEIFDKITTIILFFTKSSQQLYKIEATFHVIQLKPEERKYFYESLYSQLTDKYGKATKVSSSQKKNNKSILESISELLARSMIESLIGSSLVWNMGTDSQLSLNYKKNYHTMLSYKLVYFNKSFASKNDTEISRAIQNRNDRAMSQDRDRL